MPDEDERPPALRAGCTRPVRAHGAPTRKQARGPHWRRTSHGFYVPSSVPTDSVDQRIVEASVVVPPRCAINGWASLRWRGGRWFDGLGPAREPLPVGIVISSHDVRPQPGIALSAEAFDPRLVEWVDGVPVIDARYAVAFQMRYARSWRAAANELSKAAYNDLVSIEEMTQFLTPGQNGMTGVPQARRALGWAEENVWSPYELPMSLLWQVEADRPRPLCNRPIFDLAGRHVATPDLFDPVTGVGGEYDGELHLDRGQRDRDLRRDGALRHYDLELVYATAPDLHDPRAFVGRLHDAYRRAARRQVSDRTWTIEPPAWWVPVDTVEQRRALTAQQRRRFLGHRTA
ncbi:hypothetical protein [Nocardioides plantarum]|uniref:Uncharacterized protein n=1 Tax=Nocardioides plantarum TaxID=29299 RepID=A0ABV5K4C2_9ACTN|nr:hypothetical protein [Nocardioides plantarum]